jgi:hypothetical protein
MCVLFVLFDSIQSSTAINDHNEEVIPYSDFYSVAVNKHASLEVCWSTNDIWYFCQYFLLYSRTSTTRNIMVIVKFKFGFYK